MHSYKDIFEREITKEQFERAKLHHGYIAAEDMEDIFDASERYGYGVYGPSAFERDGKYFVHFSLGSTCD